MKVTSLPSGHSFCVIASIRSWWLPIGKSVRPMLPWNKTSPTMANLLGRLKNTTWPGVWPGQWITSSVSSPTVTVSPSTSQRSGSNTSACMPYLAPSSSSRLIQKRSASCGPSIGRPNSFASTPASPQWSIWPCVMRIFSSSTPDLATAALSLSRSPPGSTSAPLLVAVHQISEQFCCSGVTGTIPAFMGGVAGFWVSVSIYPQKWSAS